mgnify:CR=1 FL=1
MRGRLNDDFMGDWGENMELYIARFADDSYQVVIKADSYESAREKAIQYIKTNHTWFESDYNFNGLDIALLDEDYVIE